MIPLPFVRACSPLVPLTALGSVLLAGLLWHSSPIQADTLSPQRIQELTDLGAQIADRERAMKEAEQQLQRPDLSPADRERLTKEVGDHRDFIKTTRDGVAAQGADQKRVLDRAIEARSKQYQLKDARAAAAKDPSDKKAQRTVKRLETELQSDYKDIGKLPTLASAAMLGSSVSSNLAGAVLLNDECKNQVMLSSRSPALPNTRVAVRSAGNPLLHLVQRGGGKTQADESNLPPDMGGRRGTTIQGKVPDTMAQGKSRSRGPGTLEVFDKDGKSHFLHVDKDGKFSGWVDDPDFKPVRAELQTGPDMQHIDKTYYSFQDGRFVEVPPQVQAAVQAIMLHMMGLKGHTHLTNTADATKQGRKTVKLDTFQASVDSRHKDETPEHLIAGFLNWGQVSSGAPVFFSGDVGRGDFNLSIPTQADFAAFDPKFKIGDWSHNLTVGVDYFQGCRRIPESALSTGGDLNLGEVAVNNSPMFNSVLDGGVDYWAFKGTLEQQGFNFDSWTPIHVGRQTVLAWEIDERTYQDFRSVAGNQVISGMFDVGINIAPAPALDPVYWPQHPATAIPRWTIDRRLYREED